MIIIPARLASTRFPAKVLYEINGTPMVILTALRAKEVDDVAIATDSQEVVEVAKKHGFEAVLTSSHHKSGTDRVNEAATKLGLTDKEVILNVQADEPFIEPEVIEAVKKIASLHKEENQVMMASAYKELSYPDRNDPNLVKVVTSSNDFALYFSRSLVPFDREAQKPAIKAHLGIYGYTKKMLERFCSLEPAPLEDIEKLEQLRALFHGYKIAMTKVTSSSVGIDTIEDLVRLGLR